MRTLIAAATAVLVLLGAARDQFRVRVEGVRVDVLVTEAGRPVVGLEASDFELRDNGVVQDVGAVALEDVPLSVMLALDTSDSVKGEPLRHLREAASAVARLLRPEDHAALMTFSDDVRLESPWSADHDGLDRMVGRSEAGVTTALHDAAYAALTLRDPRPGRTLVLILSDGADTASWLSGAQVLDIGRRSDAVVYGVTLAGGGKVVPGHRLDFHSGAQEPFAHLPPWMLSERFLDALAAETGGKVMNAERSERLRDTFVQVVNEFRSRYVLTYSPRGVDAGGWHPLEVKLTRRAGKVTARKGYLR